MSQTATGLVVETSHLSKTYGPFLAVRDLNMNIAAGSIYGFIGPNGAGKTTTMRMLATLLRPSGGDARVGGYSVVSDPKAVKRQIGYMPDFFGVYDNMKTWEYLDFFAASYKVPANRRVGMIDDLLNLVDLSHKKNDYVDALSRGMKQRLSIARTLVSEPTLLILDEPASGLDPRARIELRELLKELGRLGKTILISSHILSELAEMCTHIGIIERGVLLASGSVQEILQRVQPIRVLLLRLLADPGTAAATVQAVPGVVGVEVVDEPASPAQPAPAEGAANRPPLSLRVRFDGDERAMGLLLWRLVQTGLPVYSFSEEVSNLEDIFLQVTKGLVD